MSSLLNPPRYRARLRAGIFQAAALIEKAKTVILMEPNDLPIVVLPLELSDDSAANLIKFLNALTEALERHYAGELLRREHRRSNNHRHHIPPISSRTTIRRSEYRPPAINLNQQN
jgi:hypothetical protein